MHKKTRKKLTLNKETLRTLAPADLRTVAGGISGLRGCHSIQDQCHTADCDPTYTDANCHTGLWSQCAC